MLMCEIKNIQYLSHLNWTHYFQLMLNTNITYKMSGKPKLRYINQELQCDLFGQSK